MKPLDQLQISCVFNLLYKMDMWLELRRIVTLELLQGHGNNSYSKVTAVKCISAWETDLRILYVIFFFFYEIYLPIILVFVPFVFQLSILVHPDKNADDRDRAQNAFDGKVCDMIICFKTWSKIHCFTNLW